MKPNSCLYRAVKRVAEYQFGVKVSSYVFDKHNSGEGVPTVIMCSVINEALSEHGIKVSAVYGNITDSHLMDMPQLIRKPQFVSAPCIGHEKNHVEGILPGEFFSADIVVTLERIAS